MPHQLNDPPLNLSSFQLGLQKDLELVSTLHHLEYNAPLASDLSFVLQNICIVFACITLAFVTFIIGLKNASTKIKIAEERKLVIAYQATNLCVNLILGLFGIYHYNVTLPHMNELAVTERIVGFDQYVIFAVFQIGYNLWSIPVGYFFMNEEAAMMFHHIATICVSLVSAFSMTGMKYHGVFFFGLIEISSVPLAIMNFCKNNADLAELYCPTLRDVIRPIFAAMFLTTRVVMWTPNISDVLRSGLMLLWTSTSLTTSLSLVLFLCSAFYLTFLQYFWGMKVLKGIVDKVKSMEKAKTL